MGIAVYKTDFTSDSTWYEFGGLYMLYKLYKLYEKPYKAAIVTGTSHVLGEFRMKQEATERYLSAFSEVLFRHGQRKLAWQSDGAFSVVTCAILTAF